MVVAQRLAELAEERRLARDVGRVDGQHLLELVELDHLVGVGGSSAPQVLRQRATGQRRDALLPVPRDILLQAQQRAQHVAVHARRRAPRRWHAKAHDRPDREPLGAQPRQQPGLQQRALARVRRRVEQHDALREQQVEQARQLAVTPVQPLAGPQRARPDVRVVAPPRAHVADLPPGRCAASSRRKSSALPQ